jgi:CBS domain-containing protein
MYYMFRENIGAVVVEEDRRPLGIITEKDILVRAVSEEKDLYKTRAQDVMSKPVWSIEANRPIRKALELMRTHNIRRLVVTDMGQLVGIVTERRLLAEILTMAS